jgi:transposase InsO family protein
MGVTIQFESHRVELAGIYEMEHDADVLEYFDQPPAIKLDYASASGKRMGVLHTPDFFVIRHQEAGWEEWKTEEELHRLTAHNPNRYSVGKDGPWHCPPGNAYAERLGLYYRVRCSKEINWTYQRNIQFLDDYFRADAPSISTRSREFALAYVSAAPSLSLDDLLQLTKDVVPPDEIFTMIAMEVLHVDIHAQPLAEPSRVAVFASKDALLHRRQIEARQPVAVFESLVSQNCGANGERCAESALHEQLMKASEDDLLVANRRAAFISRYLEDGTLPTSSSVPLRTFYVWLARYRQSESSYGTGFLGLLPQTSRRGNCNPKLPEASRRLLEEFIDQDYETLKQKTRYASWVSLKHACEEKGILVPSYKTFCVAVRQRPLSAQTAKRQGRRASYQVQTFYWELELKTPRHGDRPFEIAHIDHTELDIQLVCSRTSQILGRPWLTLLTDAFSRRTLAFYLTFDPPSYRSCMMTLRECVRRLGRLPQILVVDGGREFASTYFETLLARYECTKKVRPPAQARFGSVCERLFGTTNTRFVHNLLGNTQITRNVRQVTKSVNPKEQAAWPLAALYDRLGEYLYEIYDTIQHPVLGQSPREAYLSGLAASGQRPQRQIAYDQEFLIWTLATTPKGAAKVSPGRGVKLNHVFYWSDALRDPTIEGQQVEVRYDPFDAGIAYAYVGKRWVQCISEHYGSLQGKSERELMLATTELRKRAENHASQFTITAKKLANFLLSVEAEESLRIQRLQDREAKSVRTTVECGFANVNRPDLTGSIDQRDPPDEGTLPSISGVTTTDELTAYEEY